MNRSILLSLLFTGFSLACFAQKKLKVNEKNENVGGGSNNALVVTIYEANKRDVEKSWKSEMKKLGAKVKSKKEIFADDAKMSAMGDNTFDVYAKINDLGNEVIELIVAVDLGGAFMSSGNHSSQTKTMKDMVYDFAVQASKDALSNKISNENKVLKNLEKDQSGLEKDNEKLHKDIASSEEAIEKAKQEIEEAKKEIEENKKNQEKKKKEIAAQSEAVKQLEKKLSAVN